MHKNLSIQWFLRIFISTLSLDKESDCDKIEDGVTMFIFFTDKDFDYIEVNNYLLSFMEPALVHSYCLFVLSSFGHQESAL